MLALDRTLCCIEASESDVLDLFQSAPLAIALIGSKPEPRVAYVCAVQKKSNVQVYVAFAAKNRRMVVYTKSGSNDSIKTYAASLEEALEFARSMGFAPERVNLDYSPALRAVVIRNFKILNLPSSKANAPLKKGVANAPVPDIKEPPVPHQDPSAASLIPVVPAARVVSTEPVVSATKIAAQPAVFAEARNRRNQEEAMADILRKLRNEMEAVGAERDALSVQVQELSALLQSATAELNSVRMDCVKLTAERDKLAQSALDIEMASSELAALRNEVVLLSQQRDEANQRIKDFLAKKAALAKTDTSAHEEISNLIIERDAALRRAEELTLEKETACSEREALRAEVASLSAEGEAGLLRVEQLEMTSSELVALRNEVVLLSEQRDEADRCHKELLAKSAALAESATGAQEKAAKIIIERDAALRRAEELAQEKETVGTEREALRAEVTSLSAEREAGLLRVEQLELQNAAKDVELDAMSVKLTALGAEREMLLEHGRQQSNRKEMIEAQLSTTTLRPQRAESDLSFESNSIPAAGGQIEQWEGQQPELVDSFFASFSEEESEDCPERFLLQSAQTAIEYNCPEDLVELQKSINLANMSPDGKGQESCQGYICCLRRGDAVQVYVALYGTQSGKTTVYLPEMQPADKRTLAVTVAGAVSFAEQVGLMMEPVKLGSSQQRAKSIMNCPVLRGTSPLGPLQ